MQSRSKPNVKSNDSIFYKLYEIFQKIVDENCVPIETKEENERQESEAKTLEFSRIELTTTKETIDHKSEQISIKSLTDILYTKKSVDNYCQLTTNIVKQMKQTKDDFNSKQSLIKLSSDKSIEFPFTDNLDKILPNFEVIFGEEQRIESKDDSFAQSLIESCDESFNKGFKRKSSQSNTSLVFKSPRIEKVETFDSKDQ